MNEHEDCHVEPVEKTLDEAALQTAQAVLLYVSGMSCPRCATRVRNGLLFQQGVLYADVDLEYGVATVAYDPEQMTADDLVTAVADVGNGGHHLYQARVWRSLPAYQAVILEG